MFQNKHIVQWALYMTICIFVLTACKNEKVIEDKRKDTKTSESTALPCEQSYIDWNNSVARKNEKLYFAIEIKDFIDAYPSTLSGGMRQRVALIRTLALKPNLLLLDEPFSALDYITRLNLEDDVNNIIRKEQKSAIIVTHDISEAISLSDRVIVISKRPSKILGNYQIKLNFEGKEHTPTNARTTKEFQVFFDKIYKDLSHEE